ncbi:hypothetical protein ACLK1V_10920 [Escherichia coli]
MAFNYRRWSGYYSGEYWRLILSNAKTICDHLAVLRPDVWLMIGHCGGLRESQAIGDYVLAHAYLRDDHVLDAVSAARYSYSEHC